MENRPRIRIDPGRAAYAHRRHCERLEQARERFVGHRSLDVSYEELSDDWTGTAARVQRFLNVPALTLPQTTVRGEHRRLEDVVGNSEQLAETIRWRQTRFY